MTKDLALGARQAVERVTLLAPEMVAGRLPAPAQRRRKNEADHRAKTETVAQGCAREIKVRAPMLTSMSAEGEVTETEPTGGRESTLAWMIAGAALEGAVAMSTCEVMATPLVAAKTCCVATGNASPASDAMCGGAAAENAACRALLALGCRSASKN
jgi:hypothetical protein